MIRLDKSVMMQYVSDMFESWGGDEIDKLTPLECFGFAVKKYPYTSPVHVYSLQRTYIGQLGNIQSVCAQMGLCKTEHVENSEIMRKLKIISTRIVRFFESVSNLLKGRNASRCSQDAPMVAMQNGIVCDLRNLSKYDTVSMGFTLVLDQFARMQLRRRGNRLYKPVTVPIDADDVFINAFEHFYVVNEADTIVDIVSSMPRNCRVSIHWGHVNDRIQQIADRLSHCNNNSLPRLVTNGLMISFANGQYSLLADELIPYRERGTDEPVTFSGIAFKDKHMDIYDEFRDPQNFKTGRWFGLAAKCPNFMKLVSYQYPRDTPPDATYNSYATPELDIRILLAFLGRLLFPIGMLEEWQMALAVIGTSNVGKTKLLEMMMGFFGTDIFNIKNNMEQQFGMETAIDKRLAVIEEMHRDSSIPGDMMLSMVCGGLIPIARKGKAQQDVQFKMALFGVGNSFPRDWPNERKQTSRRWMISHWGRPVAKKDINQNFAGLMDDERPAILLLITRAYQSLVRTLNGVHVDRILTPDIRRDTAEVISGSDDISEFLKRSNLVVFEKDSKRKGMLSNMFIPLYVLMAEWKQFFSGNNNRGSNRRYKTTRRGGRAMTKEQFNRILEYSGARVLMMNDCDEHTGATALFNLKKYPCRYLLSYLLFVMFSCDS